MQPITINIYHLVGWVRWAGGYDINFVLDALQTCGTKCVDKISFHLFLYPTHDDIFKYKINYTAYICIADILSLRKREQYNLMSLLIYYYIITYFYVMNSIILNHIFYSSYWKATFFASKSYPMITSSNGNIFRVTGHLCGAFTGPGEFPAQRPVTRSFDVFFDLRLNKRLSKQSWGWWFETLPCSLWRHHNVFTLGFPCVCILHKRLPIFAMEPWYQGDFCVSFEVHKQILRKIKLGLQIEWG